MREKLLASRPSASVWFTSALPRMRSITICGVEVHRGHMQRWAEEAATAVHVHATAHTRHWRCRDAPRGRPPREANSPRSPKSRIWGPSARARATPTWPSRQATCSRVRRLESMALESKAFCENSESTSMQVKRPSSKQADKAKLKAKLCPSSPCINLSAWWWCAATRILWSLAAGAV